jgi:hypothetical protein
MAIDIHSQIVDDAEIHVPKGFSEAGINQVPSKNSSGELEWVSTDSFSGPQGPTGAAGSLATIPIADATNPIELNSISDVEYGLQIIADEHSNTDIDKATMYVYNENVTLYGANEIPPYIMHTSKGGNTRWVAGVGAYAIDGPIETLSGDRYINKIEQEVSGYSASTGVLKTSTTSINVDTTKVDISALTGQIVDAYTDPENIQIYQVDFAGQTAITVDNLLTDTQSFFAIAKGALNTTTGKYDGVVVQSPTEFTTEELKDYIVVGFAIHINKTIVESVSDTFRPITNPANSIAAIAEAIGTLTKGNVYSASGANRKLNKSAGIVFSYGANLKGNPKDEHNVPTPSQIALNFFTNYQDGAGGFNPAITSDMDTNFYDNGSGVLQVIPNNRYAAFRPFLTVTNQTILAYPQAHYASVADAIAALSSEAFVKNPNLDGVPQRGGIVFKKGISDFQAAEAIGEFQIVNGSKFDESLSGGGASSSTTTQQVAYNNSSPNPEILTSTANGAMTYRRGSALETDDVLEVQNNAGAQKFSIKGSGETRIESQAYSATNTLVDAANIVTDMALGNVHEVTLADNRILDLPTNLKNGSTILFIIKQDATGGRTLDTSAFLTVGGEPIVLTTTANAVDILSGISDGTNVYLTIAGDFK